MSNKAAHRDLLFRKQRGRCFWCRCNCVRSTHGKPPLANSATLDHVHDRFDPLRGRTKGRVNVMACYACNQRRNQERLAWVMANEREAAARRRV